MKPKITALIPSANPVVPPDELERLQVETNFTTREIQSFYKYASTKDLTKQEFATLCFEQNITASILVDRLWYVFDRNHDGHLTRYEMVRSLHPLLRGTRHDVAGLWYDIYDLDQDGDLTPAEIVAVYSDMVGVCADDERSGLHANEKRRIREWVMEASKDGTLSRDDFVGAVVEDMVESENSQKNRQPKLLSWRTVYFVFLTAWFEVGTSFSLPAMGALSSRIKHRFDVGDQEIGTLTSAYFFAAMVGPLVGGLLMDRIGPGPVVIAANCVVTLGAAFQAIADRPSHFTLLLVGRLLLGFGGEITPFTTIEILGRLFPDYLGLMAGIRNLVQSTSTFLAFVLLPAWANALSNEELDNRGTSFALWMCAVLGVVSTLSCLITYCSMRKENVKTEEFSDQRTITTLLHAFSRATAPRVTGWGKWQLPLSFFFACYGIKAQYFAPFGFTAFSNEIYADKFRQSRAQASMHSGIISLIAGLMGPIMGPLSDKYGQRSLSLSFVCLLSMVGFMVLAISSGGSGPVWAASILFSLQYGFGDTVAYISIRFIVGVSRSGLGYGVYGIIGNLIATIVPIIGGSLLDQDNGNDKVLWYFVGLMALGVVCWVFVYLLEGSRSLLELPAKRIIETSDKDLQVAALTYVVGRHPNAETATEASARHGDKETETKDSVHETVAVKQEGTV